MYHCNMNNNQLLKGTLQTIILRLLQENQRLYGYEITQKVKELSDGTFQLAEGSLYPALYKLEAEGYLETSTEIVDGRVRKYYSLSSEGESRAISSTREAAEFIEKLQLVLNLKPNLT
jgi:PadR family transcriptional regulator PadR